MLRGEFALKPCRRPVSSTPVAFLLTGKGSTPGLKRGTEPLIIKSNENNQ